MKYTAEEIANKYFRLFPNLSKNELRTDIEKAIAAEVNEALYNERAEELNDPKNYRVAIRESDLAHFILFVDLVNKAPDNWSIIRPNKGTLSKEFYTSEGNILPEMMRKFPVIRTEADLRLNR